MASHACMNILRYLSILPCSIVAWMAALFVSLRMEYCRAIVFCPDGMREGSDCYAEEWVRWPVWLISFGASLSAILIVGLAALLAPKNKLQVSFCTYLVGAFLAMNIAVLGDHLIPFIASLLAGCLSVMLVARFTNTPLATVMLRAKRYNHE